MYLDELKPLAIKYRSDTGPASLTVAQSILETGNGKHAPGNNYFGIKWVKGRDPIEMRQTLKTMEWNPQKNKYETVMADFMAFKNMEQSLEWYAKTIMALDRYKETRASRDFIEAATNVRLAGYATSPSYTTSLLKVMIS